MTQFRDWAGSFVNAPLEAHFASPPFVTDSNSSVLAGKTATLRLNSLYEPALLYTDLSAVASMKIMTGGTSPTISFLETTAKPQFFGSTSNLEGKMILLPRRQPFFVGFDDQNCLSMNAQWVGFPRNGKMHFLSGREFKFEFCGRSWTLKGTVQKPEGVELEKSFEAGRNATSSYFVQLTPDRGDVSTEHANLLFHRMSSAFSFAAGHYLPPVFASGFAENGDPLWVRFSADVRTQRSGGRWADYIWHEDFEEFIQKFMAASSDEARGDSLASAVFLYAECVSCLPSIRPAVLLGQSALEEIARWTLLNQEGLQPKFVQNTRATDLFDLLFSVLRLSKTKVAEDLSVEETARGRASVSFGEALDNLTAVRNRVAHRNPARNTQENEAERIYSAWRASCKLLEVSILASLGYRGEYGRMIDGARQRFERFYRD